jgi:diguanylate cyclase (GGDEF)-like protein
MERDRSGFTSWPLALIAGFAAQLVLIVVVTAVGLFELKATDVSLRALVAQHMLRLDLTKIMHAAARDRTMSLARMIHLKDAFDQDAETQHFVDYAKEFGIARRRMLSLSLSPQEHVLLARQGELTKLAVPYQEQVIELSAANRHAEAQEVLTQYAIPAQDAVLQVLSQLDDLTRKAANAAIQQVTEAHQVARSWMLVFSGLSLLLGLTIAGVVVRQIHRVGREREHLATHDALTGLPNRVLLLDRLDQAILRAKRYGNHVGLLFVDLDGFKAVNDRYGHQVGDELLKQISARLKQDIRAGDIVARLGGDEFIIGVLDASAAEQVIHVAEKILAAINDPVQIGEFTVSVSGSVGVCVYPEQSGDASDLLKCADAAMYEAKEAGKNQIRHYRAGK